MSKGHNSGVARALLETNTPFDLTERGEILRRW
jgi:hypothetical protein